MTRFVAKSPLVAEQCDVNIYSQKSIQNGEENIGISNDQLETLLCTLESSNSDSREVMVIKSWPASRQLDS
ncbi:hypothetical protein TNCV_3554331 [Trichonephila clavipes]|nr:hypothetical protein TNCV_3554331 [Trichonephila clavipes]